MDHLAGQQTKLTKTKASQDDLFGPGRPHISSDNRALIAGLKQGALAQLGERLICIQEVRSSILLGSTKHTALVMNHLGPTARPQERWPSRDIPLEYPAGRRGFTLVKRAGSVAQVVRAHA